MYPSSTIKYVSTHILLNLQSRCVMALTDEITYS